MLHWRQKVASPRIEALRRELKQRPAAIGEFWESVAQTGSPIVEEIPGDDGARCVTFIYRDQRGDLDHVALCWFIVLSDFANNLLLRIGDSDLMALSLRLPVGTRCEYLFSPNEPLSADERYPLSWQLDPLNPNHVVIPPNSWRPDVPTRLSVLELPEAAPRIWSHARSIDTLPNFDSLIAEDGVGDVRRIWFQKLGERTAPPERLLVVLDGWDFVYAKQTGATLSRMHQAGLIPATGIAFLDSGTRAMRIRDYSGSPAFSDYLAEKIVPMACGHFGMRHDTRSTTVCGMSSGGVTALAAAFRHPATFGNVLAVASPGVVNDELPNGLVGLVKQLEPKQRPRVHLQAGLLEIDRGTGPEDHILGSNRTLAAELNTMGFDVVLDEEPCGHGRTEFAESLVKGIRRLLGDANDD